MRFLGFNVSSSKYRFVADCWLYMLQDDVNTSMARGVLYLDACTHISKVHQVLKDELFVINREVVVN